MKETICTAVGVVGSFIAGLYYGAVAAGLLLLKLAIELDYNILLGTLLAELLITLLACGSIARKNLYQIVKGAEA